MARDPHDRDYTVFALAKACVASLPDRPYVTALDPCCGAAAWPRAIKELLHTSRVVVRDIDPAAPGLRMGFEGGEVEDFIAHEWMPGERYDLIATNPPFNIAEAFVRVALEHADVVGMLLLASFIESSERTEFWAEHPCSDVYFLRQRPSFIRMKDGVVIADNQTDQRMYAFFVWDVSHEGPTRMHILDWDKPDKAAVVAEAGDIAGQQSLWVVSGNLPLFEIES